MLCLACSRLRFRRNDRHRNRHHSRVMFPLGAQVQCRRSSHLCNPHRHRRRHPHGSLAVPHQGSQPAVLHLILRCSPAGSHRLSPHQTHPYSRVHGQPDNPQDCLLVNRRLVLVLSPATNPSVSLLWCHRPCPLVYQQLNPRCSRPLIPLSVPPANLPVSLRMHRPGILLYSQL